MVKQQAAAVVHLPPGRTLDGRYRLEGEIGEGGLGVVYRATHEKLDKAVAVKLLHAHCGDDAVMRARFEREAKALAALDHPNIVAVTDYGVEGDAPYLVMELLSGQTLAERLARGALDEPDARALAIPLLNALAYVHDCGLVHRDVKPGNVFLQQLKDGGERLKLLDFGLAKFTLDTQPDASVTRSGAVIGTPAYMSPEQASGESADARSDVYAVGVLILEMLAGRTPFAGDAIDQLRGHLLFDVPPLHQLNPSRAAHPELEAFIQRAVAKRPGDRFDDAKHMLIALEALPRPWFTRVSRAQADGYARTLLQTELATVPVTPEPNAALAQEPLTTQQPAPRSRRRSWLLGLMLLGLCALLWRERLNLPFGEARAAVFATLREAAQPAAVSGSREAMASAPNARNEHVAERRPAAVSGTTRDDAPPQPPLAASTDDANDEAVRHAEPIESESDDLPSATVAPPKPRSAARNPWRRSLPKELRTLRVVIAKGAHGSDHTIASLRRYNREHPSDVRGHLLLANLYANRDWRADAVNQYQIAYQIEPSSRGAPEMLPTLLGMVARGYAVNSAGRLIENAYRGEALSAIARALHAHQNDSRAVARLNTLRARITSK